MLGPINLIVIRKISEGYVTMEVLKVSHWTVLRTGKVAGTVPGGIS